MTTKDKLKNALDALWLIETGSWDDSNNIKIYAGKIRSTLTAPRTKTVEVKRWEIRNVPTHWFKEKGDAIGFCNRTAIPHSHIIELTGTYQRPIPEPETWEGKVDTDRHWDTCIRGVPKEWIGKKVIVEVCE